MRLSGTDFRLLKVFDAVVRHGGFAAAQTELNVGPSTISNHITALEQRLGVILCQRGRGGFKLSDKGKLVFVESQKLLRNIEEFSVGISTLKGQLVGKIKVGLVDAIATDRGLRLEQAFAEFLSEPNDIRFEVSQNTPQELQQRVLNGSLDVGIGSFPHKATGLKYQPLHKEVHSLYCGATHPLFSVKPGDLDVETLRNESIVGRGYWRDRRHEELGLVNVKAVVYEIEPQLILIRSGKFIGYLPDHFAEQWVQSGQLRCLSPLAARFDCEFDLVSKKGLKPSQALSTFVAAVLRVHAVI
ncbi:LysR family transcriptional regulator [Rhodobacteraceae bacterium Araon29]